MKILGRRAGRGNGHTLTCRQVGKVLQRFLDGEAEEITAAKVSDHLEMCRRCGMEAEAYREIKATLARAQSNVPEVALRRLRHFGAQLADGDVQAPDEGPTA